VARRAIALLLAAAALLVPAAINGFPFVFYDTGDYLAMSVTHEPIIYRTIPYALFLGAAQWQVSLWLPAAVQALMTAWLLRETLAWLAPKASPLWLIGLAIPLTGATPLPWYAGQIMPDAFTAIAALGMILLALARDLPLPRRAILLVLTVLAGIVHLSHLALLCGLFALVLLLRLLRQRVALGLPAVALLAALALPPAINHTLTGRTFYSEAGPVFLFARLVQDGIAQDYLRNACPAAGYRLCGWRDVLPETANDLLWQRDSVLVMMNGWYAMRDDAARVVRDSVIAMPLRHLWAALRNTAEQFVSFRTGEGLYNQWQDTRTMVGRYAPHQLDAYRTSLQQTERLDFRALNIAILAVCGISLLALPLLAWRTARRDAALFGGLLWLAVLGNAAICGILSNPTDRYQARIVWLVPLGVAALLLHDPRRRA
jgi:hypothetical protein